MEGADKSYSGGQTSSRINQRTAIHPDPNLRQVCTKIAVYAIFWKEEISIWNSEIPIKLCDCSVFTDIRLL